MATTNKEYDASSIKHLANRDAVRAKPALYAGSLGVDGVFTCLRECADNVVDEALNGHAGSVEVCVDDDGSYWILDDGRGMPVGMMTVSDGLTDKKHRISALQAITGLLHAGGKLDEQGSAYQVSRGCFHGSTQIRLLNGKTLSMEAIYERWSKNETPIPILTYNTKRQRLESSVISYAQITKHTRDLIEVTYDNGCRAKVTPDHPFYVRRGGSIKKVQAQHLNFGDSLVSTYYGADNDGYVTVTENGTKKMLHRIVARSALNNNVEVVMPNQVHHKNRNITNNNPSNLEIVSSSNHQREHSEERSEFAYAKIMESQRDLRIRNRARFQFFARDEDTKLQAAQTKCVYVGLRALSKFKVLNRRTYNLSRLHTDMRVKTLLKYFDSFEDYVNATIEVQKDLTTKVGYSCHAEDKLSGKHGATNPQIGFLGKLASDKAQLLAWTRKLLSFKDPRNVTPEEWNSVTRGAYKLGTSSYAKLCQFTSLKRLKAHVLDGEELTFYEDMSEASMRRRAVLGEVRASTEQRLLSFVAFCVKKLRVFFKDKSFSSSEYIRWNDKNKPSLDVMIAFFKEYLQLDEDPTEEQIQEMLNTWNHTVKSIRKITLKNAIPVYDITVDNTHTFFIEAGPAGFKSKEFQSSGVLVSNTHGLGQKLTNFTSKFFEVWTKPKEGWHYIGYKDGNLTDAVQKVTAPEHPLLNKKLSKGTLVHFKPDPKIIGAEKFPLSMFAAWARIAAYFTPNFKVILRNSKNEKEWFFEDGPKQYTSDRIETLKCTALDPAIFVTRNSLVDCVVQFTDFDGCDLQAFTNGLANVERGTHFNSVFSAMIKAIQPYAKKRQEVGIQELREGVVGLVNAKLSAPKFDSQTKEKLVDDRTAKPLQELLEAEFVAFFKKHKQLAIKLCERCDQLKELKNKFSASKQVLKQMAAIKKKGLPAKAQLAPNCKAEDRELVIIEGDSAAGSARQARDARYQECLPLKGKFSNAFRTDEGKILLNEEVLNLLHMIGFDPKSPDPLGKLRVGKIICLADPDPDGPLHPDTLIPVRISNEWESVRIEDLYKSRDTLKEMDARVIAWDHHQGRYVLTKFDVIAAVQPYAHEQVCIEWSNDTKTTCTPQHRWVAGKIEAVQRRNVNFKGEPFAENELQFIQAKDLKAGDKVCGTVNMNHPQTLLSPKFKAETLQVKKVKIRKVEDNIAFFCLTVSSYHNFILANGVLSGNCHINALSLSLFWKYMPGLFAKGIVYVAEAPEFYSQLKDKSYVFGPSVKAVRAELGKINAPANTEIHHVKGYGELSPDLLARVAFNPETRSVTRIKVMEDDSGANFVKLMSDDPEMRKKLLGV